MSRELEDRLRIGFLLDARWFAMKNQPERTKEPTFKLLVDLLREKDVPYAIIGGMALQVYVADPRTTVDIDVAVRDRREIPAAEMEALGFMHTGSFDHSENFRSPDGVMVQFSAEPEWQGVVARAQEYQILGRPIRFIAAADLVRAKLRAAADPARRRSKRIIDIGDIATLLEEHPEVGSQLSAAEQEQIAALIGAIVED